ncbi:pantoate--beta-alanine ligase [Methyloligella sp. 2.7D]|uniref:pantoate--beta-alanine ligase n=1 Tax=unclassified Methyloligella TaxID=2625955 RepID=UPI00157DA52D|nr:pantoate--beta-alanine ligase [Methyloligella sp. GL2]QKP77409.1 pantoate--beta-alanine ligase [Methyloligella sp. GL2]
MAPRLSQIRTVKALRGRIARWREAGEKIALVPTMGALHEGHLSLIELARKNADRIVVSVFVNPTQFGPGEDLEAYPRDEKTDLAKLSEMAVDAVYLPKVEEMYPDGFATTVHVDRLSKGLCGESRPGHFDGVATVVAKLLIQCAPDRAIFGEKDYQQLQIIKRMVRDLDIPTEIIGAPIVREADGLALSSRNAYLSPAERESAPLLQRTLQDMASDLGEGRPIEDALEASRFRLETGGFKVDYLVIADSQSLEPLGGVLTQPARAFAAALLGKTRLIDNIAVAPKKVRAKKKAELG